MCTDLFVFHGYGELLLGDRWVQVTPAFEKELCQEHDYPIVDFNGRKDAIFAPYDGMGRKFVEYVRDTMAHLMMSPSSSSYGPGMRHMVARGSRSGREHSRNSSPVNFS